MSTTHGSDDEQFEGTAGTWRWKCPHDAAMCYLERVEAHVKKFHADCLSCEGEVMLAGILLDAEPDVRHSDSRE